MPDATPIAPAWAKKLSGETIADTVLPAVRFVLVAFGGTEKMRIVVIGHGANHATRRGLSVIGLLAQLNRPHRCRIQSTKIR